MGEQQFEESALFERGPIRDPRSFYGRVRETNSVLDLLSSMRNCSVVAPPRTGKTSFLLHLARPQTWRAHGLDPSRYALAYLTFEGLLSHSAEEIFHSLARESLEAVMPEPFAGALQVPRGPFTLDDLLQFVSGLTRSGGRVIWFLDDLGLAADNLALDESFFRALRALADHPAVAMVTASQIPLHEIAVRCGQAGPLLADLFTTLYLGPLTQEEALAMARDIASRGGPDLEACWPHVVALVDMFPITFRVLCEVVMARGVEPREDDWDEIGAAFARQFEPVLALVWMRLSPQECEALIQVAQDRAGSVALPLLRRLEQMMLVIRENGSWRIPSTAAHQFVLGQAALSDADRVTSAVQTLGDRPSRIWDADDIMRRAVRALARTAEAHHRWGERDLAPWWAMLVAGTLGCDSQTIGQARIAARLRDIGQIATPEEILHKPAPLTPEEWSVVRAHPVVGAQILDPLELPPLVKPAVRWHHEREDGSGYPDGLVGCEIPLVARIVGVVDAYTAITSERPYRPAMPPADALAALGADRNAYSESVLTALETVIARETADG